MTHHKHHSNIHSFIKDVAKITKPIGHILETGIHSTEHVLTAPVKALEKASGNLTIPLVIGGVAILAFVVMQNRR